MVGFAKILDDPVYLLILITIVMIAATAIFAVLSTSVRGVPDWRRVYRLFLGVKVAPALVAFMRRAVTAAFALLVFKVAGALGLDEFADKTVAAGIAGGIVEAAWGALDQLVKSGQNDTDPKPVAGGAPRDS